MINRLRVILPPDSFVIGVFLLFAITEGPYVYLEWKFQQPLDSIPRPSYFVLRGVAFFYGLWRFGSFHPASHPDYRTWLERTPWNRRKALPAGPISLVWEDALPLGMLGVMGAFLGPLAPFVALNLFLVGYLIMLVVSTFSTGTRAFGYLIAFGIGLAIRYWPEPRVAFGILVVCYLVGVIAIQVALARFPWPGFVDTGGKTSLEKMQEDICGWPFDQLKPTIPDGWKLTRLDGLLFGMLAGWFLFACQSFWTARGDKVVMVQIFFGCGVVFLTSCRTLAYTVGYAPPINLFGRIRNFRWIIPGYDKVFLGPLCTILVGVLAMDKFRPPGLDDLIVLPIAFAVAITVAIDTGPTLKSWRLTGQHQITASGTKLNAEFVKVG